LPKIFKYFKDLKILI